MLMLNRLPVNWLNRPYIDLGDFNIGAFHLYGIEFNYRNLVSEKPISTGPFQHNVQVNLPPSFRDSLLRETGLLQYQVKNPLELSTELRTERWHKLCEYLTHYQELPTVMKFRVISLLKGLCLDEAVLEYVPEMSASEIAQDPILAALAFSRSMCSLMINLDSGTVQNLSELELIANYAPSGTQTKFGAALQLVVQYAKTFRNLAQAEYWREIATQELKNLKSSLDEFTYTRLLSIYYRAVVFVPLIKNDQQQVIQEMDLSESYGNRLILIASNDNEKIVADENLNIVFESRTKEALWLGDIDLAEERSQKLTQMDKLDPRYRLELGEIYIKQGKIAAAAQMYRSAARLGPPGTEIAWFMAGQCHEQLGEIDIACDCYLAAIQMDSLAISAVERLNLLAPRLGDLALTQWSNIRLSELREQQEIIANQPTTSYIPEASSELKKAAEKIMV
ncbi:tetratricopeptide repeat protein [Nostoc sp. UHCC 0870]|uniref:tetratricopeptide repeat protein n=1 Tax=Nostoc sp. UHCC 0870 TaxID=2914041 RepID=UPI001EDF6EFD|nr:tetratricopeptide repeat protein [Nostoc sp. UHCC 0870]UKO97981.1 tetratricopeptide repeat protein [Nostoc sp. UHCC 0870]